MNARLLGAGGACRPAPAGAHREHRRRARTSSRCRSPSTASSRPSTSSPRIPQQLQVPIPIPVPDITPLNPPLGRKIPIPLSYKRMNIERQTEREQSDDATARMDVVQTVVAWSRPGGAVGQRHQRVGVDRRRCATASCCSAAGWSGSAAPARPTTASTSVKSVTTTLKPGELKQRFTLEPQRPGGPRNEGGP